MTPPKSIEHGASHMATSDRRDRHAPSSDRRAIRNRATSANNSDAEEHDRQDAKDDIDNNDNDDDGDNATQAHRDPSALTVGGTGVSEARWLELLQNARADRPARRLAREPRAPPLASIFVNDAATAARAEPAHAPAGAQQQQQQLRATDEQKHVVAATADTETDAGAPIERLDELAQPGWRDILADPMRASSCTTVDLARWMATNERTGLNADVAAQRLHDVGPNELRSSASTPLWLAVLYQLTNLIIIMLIVSAAITMALGEFAEGVAILVTVALNTTIAVYTEYSADQTLTALVRLSRPNARAVRDGHEIDLPSRELVPGDIVLLHAGDVVPADGRLVQCTGLCVNEMLLTGESAEVRKAVDVTTTNDGDALYPSNLLFSGTHVVVGHGTMIVVATGASTALGQIAQILNRAAGANGASCATDPRCSDDKSLSTTTSATSEPSPTTSSSSTATGSRTIARIIRSLHSIRTTWRRVRNAIHAVHNRLTFGPVRTPLQRELHRVGLIMGASGIALCVVIFGVGMLRDRRDPERPDQPGWLQMLLLSVTLAVSAIPEGLPLAVTVCLAMGSRKLAREHALVRRVAAIETVGRVNIICTDKTGTLTSGQMTAVRVVAGHCEFGISSEPKATCDVTILAADELGRAHMEPAHPDHRAVHALRACARVGMLCNDAQVEFDAKAHRWVGTGSGTEVPLVVLAAQLGLDQAWHAKAFPRIREQPFSSDTKVMITEHRVGAQLLRTARRRHAADDGGEGPITSGDNGEGEGGTCNGDSFARTIGASQEELDLSAPASSSRSNPIAITLVCCKGAPGVVLRRCTRWMDSSGSVRELTSAHRRELEQHQQRMASQALRVLAVAYTTRVDRVRQEEGVIASSSSSSDDIAGAQPSMQQVSTDVGAPMELGVGTGSTATATEPRSIHEDNDGGHNATTSAIDLTWIGLIGCADPERPGVASAIQRARRAGVHTVMITGDFLGTAIAIARNIGLLEVGADVRSQAIDASVLRPDNAYVAAHELDSITSRTVVYARARPEDKYQIVASLQRQGNVCAMTGDGVNDAPCLKQADVGVAMGNGTSVAKQASDMVLLDDNFATIVRVVARGRTIHDNIQKFVGYLLATNVVQLVFIFLAVLIGLPTPLEPLQILFINLATDGMPALALSVGPNEADVMDRPPQRKHRSRASFFVQGDRLTMTVCHGVALFVALSSVFVAGLVWGTGESVGNALSRAIRAAAPTAGVPHGGGGGGGSGVADDRQVVATARTMVFVVLALSENARAFTVRWYRAHVFHRVLDNPSMLLAAGISCALLFAILFVPTLQRIFAIASLDRYAWLLCIAAVLFTIVVDEMLKWRLRLRAAQQQRWNLLHTRLDHVLDELHSIRLCVQHERERDRGGESERDDRERDRDRNLRAAVEENRLTVALKCGTV